MTIYDLLGDARYKNKHVLRSLIKYFTGYSELELILHYDTRIDACFDKLLVAYNRYVLDGEPLEYIVGYVVFFGRKFNVTNATLIPRPETEHMIESVIEELSTKTKRTLCDVGTGCGVLGISCKLELSDKVDTLYLTDLSDDALSVVQTNLDTYSVDAVLCSSDLLSYRDKYVLTGNICIVANLPYIPDDTFDLEVEDTVKKREPRMAFIGGSDGLDLYRRLFNEVILSGKDVTLFIEVMTFQIKLLQISYPSLIFTIVKTFHFQIQIVKVELPLLSCN